MLECYRCYRTQILPTGVYRKYEYMCVCVVCVSVVSVCVVCVCVVCVCVVSVCVFCVKFISYVWECSSLRCHPNLVYAIYEYMCVCVCMHSCV